MVAAAALRTTPWGPRARRWRRLTNPDPDPTPDPDPDPNPDPHQVEELEEQLATLQLQLHIAEDALEQRRQVS